MAATEPNFDYAQLAAGLVTAFAAEIKQAIGKAGKYVRVAITDATTRELNQYIQSTCRELALLHTIVFHDEPRAFYDYYIPLHVRAGRQVLQSVDSSNAFSRSMRIVLTGTGGSGKSMVVRHLFLDSVRFKRGIPIYFSLRKLDSDLCPLREAINASIGMNSVDDPMNYLGELATRFPVMLLLDGLDEVALARREQCHQEILELSKTFPHVQILVTSRPDESLVSWSTFAHYSVCPLSLSQASALIKKFDLPEHIGAPFAEALNGGLFAKKRDLLSTPILLIIMLMTYSQSNGVPDKEHLFYRFAFEEMFRRHDAKKQGEWKRPRRTDLSFDDFERLLAAFAAAAYAKEMFAFSESDFARLCSLAAKHQSLVVNSDHYLSDLKSAVCMFVQDGLQSRFVHRSFHEFFVACFLIRTSPDARKSLLPLLGKRSGIDSVVRMWHEMDPGVVEAEVFLPFLNKMFAEIDMTSIDLAMRQYSTALPWGLGLTSDNEFMNFRVLSIPFGSYGQNILDLIAHCFPPEWHNGDDASSKRDQVEKAFRSHLSVMRGADAELAAGWPDTDLRWDELKASAELVELLEQWHAWHRTPRGLLHLAEVWRQLESRCRLRCTAFEEMFED